MKIYAEIQLETIDVKEDVGEGDNQVGLQRDKL